MTRQFHYGRLMHKALRGLMAEVLTDVAENGLPGDHHFFITFDTTHPGVDIPAYLAERYPEEMTIVLQDWFDNLSVAPDRFAVTLNFSDQPEPLVIPLDAIRTFVDPSVEFGLRFDPTDDADDEDDDTGEAPGRGPHPVATAAPEDDGDNDDDPPPPGDGGGGDVVNLARFRKS